ncbi:MAG: hypothetical protein NUW08_02765 [Candidatus Uhrbacteria bacterium]|nr:hypothetical protein [Candidatus Uhrbacteria bacterium]
MFASNLKEAIQRALSSWLASAFMLEIISYADLVKCFGVKELITSLSPDVRGKVFCACNGGGEATRAAKIDGQSVALMISSMLKDVIVDEAVICKEISTDHMVEALPNERLYALVFGDTDGPRPWDGDRPACKKFIAAAHTTLHAERVLEPDEYVALLENKLIGEHTPIDLLVFGQLEATRLHREGKTYSGADFIQVYAPEAVVAYVALADLFPAIEAVARRHGWIKDPNETLDAVALADLFPAIEGGDEPELSVLGPASGPPDMDLMDVEADELEELESSDETSELDTSSTPPSLGGKRKKDRRDADSRG